MLLHYQNGIILPFKNSFKNKTTKLVEFTTHLSGVGEVRRQRVWSRPH